MDKMKLGDRMKLYEKASDSGILTPRLPVIIRVDGKSFHTFTKRIKPSNDASSIAGPSEKFNAVMANTTMELCNNIQNAVFAYHQSDEISILLRDWSTHETQQWFGGKSSKITSISASMATAFFGYFWSRTFSRDKFKEVSGLPLFDSRVFILPKSEVTNYFVWRQKDAIRNSVNFVARKFIPHKQLHGKSIQQVQDALLREHGINWSDLKTWKRRGSANVYTEDGWKYDSEIPIFTQDREYIDQFLR